MPKKGTRGVYEGLAFVLAIITYAHRSPMSSFSSSNADIAIINGNAGISSIAVSIVKRA